MDEVKLHGHGLSPYSWIVIWALKLKGVPYVYLEEDLSNKSPMLLQHNPVHKKIPVLVHGGKPICESLVILEYIEETWPHEPNLLPADPYDRAVARFWLKFAGDKVPTFWRLPRTRGEEQEQGIKGSLEILQILEDHGLKGKKFFGGDNINLVDIAFGGVAMYWRPIESIVGKKLVEAQKFPFLHAWIMRFNELPLIKENHPVIRSQLKP